MSGAVDSDRPLVWRTACNKEDPIVSEQPARDRHPAIVRSQRTRSTSAAAPAVHARPPVLGSSGRRCILIGARDRGRDGSKMSWPTWGPKSGGMRGNARTDGRRQQRGRGPARAFGPVPRARRGQPSRGMARGFSGMWSPRLHVVKQERPRVTAVLCRGIFRATASRAPSRNLASPSGFPRACASDLVLPIVASALGTVDLGCARTGLSKLANGRRP